VLECWSAGVLECWCAGDKLAILIPAIPGKLIKTGRSMINYEATDQLTFQVKDFKRHPSCFLYGITQIGIGIERIGKST